MQSHVEYILEKLEHLSPSRQAEVANFVDFLQQRDNDQHLQTIYLQASESSLENIWNNSDDAIYDTL